MGIRLHSIPPTLFQAKPEFSQIQQSPVSAEQNPSKKKAWIPFDSLGRIEPFQWVAPIARARNSFSAPFLAMVGMPLGASKPATCPTYHDF
jgi:hypothetical protein